MPPLPYTRRSLLETVLGHEDGATVTADDVEAVAGWVADRLQGRGRAELAPGGPADWAQQLAVPVEKLGRLLRIEDALRECLRHWPPEV